MEEATPAHSRPRQSPPLEARRDGDGVVVRRRPEQPELVGRQALRPQWEPVRVQLLDDEPAPLGAAADRGVKALLRPNPTQRTRQQTPFVPRWHWSDEKEWYEESATFQNNK